MQTGKYKINVNIKVAKPEKRWDCDKEEQARLLALQNFIFGTQSKRFDFFSNNLLEKFIHVNDLIIMT
jgi:hypothetical protein